MPLIPTNLISSLTTVFTTKPGATPVKAAEDFANAYTSYVSTGTFGASLPVILPSNTAAMKLAMLAVFSLPVGTPASFGAAVAAGLTAFWASPPPPVLGVQSGVVTAIPGASSVVGPCTAIALNPFGSAAATAAVVGAAMHAASLTTQATVAPPPSTVLTLS